MRVGREALEVVLHVLVQIISFWVSRSEKPPQLRAARQVAVDEQIGRLDKGRVLRQFLDRNAPIAQDALLPIDERDRAGAGSGVAIAVIQRDVLRLIPERGDVNALLPFGAHHHRQFICLAVQLQFCHFAHGMLADFKF